MFLTIITFTQSGHIQVKLVWLIRCSFYDECHTSHLHGTSPMILNMMNAASLIFWHLLTVYTFVCLFNSCSIMPVKLETFISFCCCFYLGDRFLYSLAHFIHFNVNCSALLCQILLSHHLSALHAHMHHPTHVRIWTHAWACTCIHINFTVVLLWIFNSTFI